MIFLLISVLDSFEILDKITSLPVAFMIQILLICSSISFPIGIKSCRSCLNFDLYDVTYTRIITRIYTVLPYKSLIIIINN